jgi:hypothetical protein
LAATLNFFAILSFFALGQVIFFFYFKEPNEIIKSTLTINFNHNNRKIIISLFKFLNKGLRQVVFGNAGTPPRGEWMRTGFMFDKDNPFGLRCPRNATRGLQSVVQAYIIKHLIFDNRPKDKSIPIEQLLKPKETEQTTVSWPIRIEMLINC